MLQLSRLFRVYRYPGCLLCLSNDLQHFLFSLWAEASQWPNFYVCLVKPSLTNKQHDLPTESDQIQAVVVSWSVLLPVIKHRHWMLVCPFQPLPVCLFICPFHFHSPGSLWAFFFFSLDHDSQGYWAVQIFFFFFFSLEVCMCVYTPSVKWLSPSASSCLAELWAI